MMNSISAIRTLLPALALAAAAGTAACSGSALDNAPLSPSAAPALTLSAEAGAEDAVFGALDKGKDKGKKEEGKKEEGKKEEGTTTTTTTVVEAEGVIATATGTCPAKTFTVKTYSITTSATTVYEEGVCADLIALAEIEVRAERQADGTLVATKIEFKDADEDEVDDDDEADDDEDAGEDGRHGNPHHGAGPHSGTVSSFRGTCPTVNFNLKGLRVSTTATTKFEGGTCEVLRPNVHVTVTGTAGTEPRTFVATAITIDRTH